MDFGTAPNLSALFAALGEAPRPPEPGEEKKPTAAEATKLSGRRKIERKTAAHYVYDLTTSRAAMELLERLPGPGESFHCLMGGEFHGFDVIVAVQELAGEAAQALTISTLGFNRHNISHLCRMIDAGRASNVRVLCSDYFRGADKGTYLFAERELADRGAKLSAARNHSKISCFDFGARKMVLEGSANLRSCNNLEQFTLTNCAELHDFHAEWIRRIIDNAP